MGTSFTSFYPNFSTMQQGGVARPAAPLWGTAPNIVLRPQGKFTAVATNTTFKPGGDLRDFPPLQPQGGDPYGLEKKFYEQWKGYQQIPGFQYGGGQSIQTPKYLQGGQNVQAYQQGGGVPQYYQGGQNVQAYQQGAKGVPEGFKYSPFSYGGQLPGAPGTTVSAPTLGGYTSISAPTAFTPAAYTGVNAPAAFTPPSFTTPYAAVSAPTAQAAGAFTPSTSPLQGQLEQQLGAGLANPSAYGSANIASQFDVLNRRLGQGFEAERQRTTEEMARRGILSSTITGGRLGDLATNQAQAQSDLATNLLNQSASRYGQDRSAAIAQAMGYGGLNFGNQLASYQANLAGTGQNFQQDLATRAFQGDQNALKTLNALQQSQFGLQAQGQQFGQQLAGAQLGAQQGQFGAQFGLQGQNQQFGQQLAGAQFGAQQGQFGAQNRLAGQQLNLAAQQGLGSQQLANAQFGLAAQGQGFGQAATGYGINQGAQQQQFQNAMQQAQLGNQFGQQGFQNQLAAQGFNQALAQQGFQNQMDRTNLQSQLGQQGFQNQLAAQGFNQGLAQQGFENQMGVAGFQNLQNQQGFQNALQGYGANLGANQQGFGQQQQLLGNLLGYGQQSFENQLAFQNQQNQSDVWQQFLPLFSGLLGGGGGT